ncbi:glycosyltransferase [Luteococcus sp. OSA5]|uniref:glycosyltransferase n=1 Tax=Luteococcus sp. OSA5 TaxID=3401630 RepID=UPI003B4393C9
MTRMVVITRAWPYPPGEQFVDGEAPFWVRDGLETVVMPWWADGQPRLVPAGLQVDLTLTRRSRADDLRAAAEAPLLEQARQEIAALRADGRLDKAQLANVIRTTRGALVARDRLRGWIRRNGPIDVLYSYWFDSWTLGALLLKGEGIGRVATRVHGYDLYEERHPAGHHALRRLLVDRLDLLLPVSRAGGEHAVQTYGIDESVVHHAPLGVDLPEQLCQPSPAGQLNLLSVASCLPVKRIDRLVQATQLLAQRHPELQVRWTHLGGGQLHDQLVNQAGAQQAENLTIELPGQVDHDRVRSFLREQPVDLFVNTSESEGVPVSVMEAMAAGVPAMAPRVGALDEIIPGDGPAGHLFGPAPTTEEIAEALWQWRERSKSAEARDAARQVIAHHYERAANHTRLMHLLLPEA